MESSVLYSVLGLVLVGAVVLFGRALFEGGASIGAQRLRRERKHTGD